MSSRKVVYANNGTSVYDEFFLSYLRKKYKTALLTFENSNLVEVENVKIYQLKDIIPKLPILDDIRQYLLSFIRGNQFKYFLKKINPDLLIGNYASNYGFISALTQYKPFILFVWGSDVLINPKYIYLRVLVKYSLHKADGVVVDSDVQKIACINLGCAPEKILKFPWFDFRSIENQNTMNNNEKRALFKKLGWQEKDPIVISTRNHYSILDVDCLIQAVPYIIEEIPNIRILILGSGPLTTRLIENSKILNLETNIKFLGNVEHQKIKQYLCLADVYVSTSLSDGTSASLLEAMTCKIPSIVTDLPANREWITNGKNGILFPIHKPKILAREIIHLLGDENLKSSIKDNAYNTVALNADWKVNSKKLDNLIMSLINK